MLAVRLTDSDFDESLSPRYISEVTRCSSRGVVFDEESGKIVMIYLSSNGYYKLPGGGIEGDESKEEAFIREVKEETSRFCQIIRDLGFIEEHKYCNDFSQFSNCFLGRTVGPEMEHEYLESHKWMDIDEAIRIMDQAFKQCNDYGFKYMLMRDKIILEEAGKYISGPLPEK